ncbi:MAG: DUF2244 domain-containing protein [Paracoccus sp. (in: a-proteobacteria)]
MNGRKYDGRHVLRIWPHRSLSQRGFVWFIAVTATLASLPLLAALGRVMFWVLRPFMLVMLGALRWAIAHSYRDGTIEELLELTPWQLKLTRRDPGRADRH